MNMSFLDSILYQFDHEVWEGFRFWDLVMPLFLFMTGASMPFSLSKYIGTTGSYWYLCIGESRSVFSPVYLRNDCSWKPARSGRHASLFVFQYIAVYCCRLSYCCGHSVALPVQVAGRDNVATPSRLLGSDDVLGDFTPAGNFAEQVDRCVLGRFRDGVFWNEDGTWSFSPSYNYTWMWSSPTFGVTVMLGAFAGKIMKEGKANRKRVVQTLLVVGLALVGTWRYCGVCRCLLSNVSGQAA